METDEVLDLLRRVSAEVVDPRFGNLAAGEVRSKRRPGDLVTVADREAELLLASSLQQAYPEALVLGEEAVSQDPSLVRAFRAADHAFTVDPVDGTRHFAKGSPDHALMLAEVRSGEVVRSWIWQPQHGSACVAERGAGAWVDGRRLQVEPSGQVARSLASRSWPRRVVGAWRGLRLTATCCGIDYPRLASGSADYAAYLKTKPWDHAPGSLLLTEAGGTVTTLDGRPYRVADSPRGLVAATDADTAELVRRTLHAVPGL